MLTTAVSDPVSIHAFRGEGDSPSPKTPVQAVGFNPRLPGGRRPDCLLRKRTCSLFQSTPSGGKATFRDVNNARRFGVSIHAFRGEGDAHQSVPQLYVYRFQSTPSGGKATRARARRRRQRSSFNPRLPGGRRPKITSRVITRERFNPRLPGGRRPSASYRTYSVRPFQSTPSGGKATCHRRISTHTHKFQSTPSGGKATAISRAAVPCSRQIL